MAFCAIIDRHRPDLLDYEECDPENPLDNLEKAFQVAEKDLGIIRIVDPEDVCVKKPDDKAVMTYVSFLYHAFPDMPPSRKRKVREFNITVGLCPELEERIQMLKFGPPFPLKWCWPVTNCCRMARGPGRC